MLIILLYYTVNPILVLHKQFVTSSHRYVLVMIQIQMLESIIPKTMQKYHKRRQQSRVSKYCIVEGLALNDVFVGPEANEKHDFEASQKSITRNQ